MTKLKVLKLELQQGVVLSVNWIVLGVGNYAVIIIYTVAGQRFNVFDLPSSFPAKLDT